jgi:excisionase family DNA binding protein
VSDDEIMTVDEVARYLKLKPQTVYKWAQEDQIPCAKLGKEWRFRRSLLDEWIDSSVVLSKAGFDLLVRSSLGAVQRNALSREELDKILREVME